MIVRPALMEDKKPNSEDGEPQDNLNRGLHSAAKPQPQYFTEANKDNEGSKVKMCAKKQNFSG